jgi:hypothetical protein
LLLVAVMVAILAVMAVALPRHAPFLDHRTGTGNGYPYAYSVVECPPHDDLCLGA